MGRVKEYSMSRPGNADKVKSQYFIWLCEALGVNQVSNSYFLLTNELHKHEYRWFVPNDDNRAADGKQLREQFLEETDYYPWPEFTDAPCSMLEMLIGMANRCVDMFYDDPEAKEMREWYWIFIKNMGLDMFTDETFGTPVAARSIANIVARVLDRQYTRSGKGGIFPLRNSKKDLRNVELWYQMQAWLQENYVNATFFT